MDMLKQGNSAEQIEAIIQELSAKMSPPVLFFLDGHFSSGETALGSAETGETPILGELRNCLSYKSIHKSAIVIDDSRMFQGFDSKSCKSKQFCYPSLSDIAELVCSSKYGNLLNILLHEDQVVIMPKNVKL